MNSDPSGRAECALFAHDHVFYAEDGRYFSNGSFPRSVLSRYLALGRKLVIVSRQASSGPRDRFQSRSDDPQFDFIAVPNFRNVRHVIHVFQAKKIVDRAVKDADIVVARLPSSIGLIASEAARRHQVPLIVEVVGCTWDASRGHGSLIGKLVAPISFILTRRAVARANYVSYITRNFLQRRYPAGKRATTAVCANVSLERLDEVALKNRVLRIRTRKQKYWLGLIGSLDVDYKGHGDVLRAIALLKVKHPGLRVRFLGGGSSGRWERLARDLGVVDLVCFDGVVPSGEAVFTWLDSIDLQVQPSTAEAQGRAIIEGMSRACPVVASSVGGIVELLDANALVNPGDPEMLADVIDRFLASPELMEVQAKRNFEESKHYLSENIEWERARLFNAALQSR